MSRGPHALLIALLCSCGSDGKETLIGEPCKVSSDCDADGVCIIDGQGGLCSIACEVPGGAMQCPLGNYCDSHAFTTDVSEREEMTLCLPACKAQGDCRPGYECNGVSGGPGKTCQPK